MTITIREIALTDAEAYLQLRLRLDAESKFMMLEPGERETSLDSEMLRLQRLLEEDNSMVFLAVDDDTGEAVGFLGVRGEIYRRNRHSGYLVIGILQAYTGQGIGTRLFETMFAWAIPQGLTRLELTVMTHNQAGIALYKKMGFAIEGTKRHALRVDGKYVDEYSMAKLLDREKPFAQSTGMRHNSGR